jgi:hypothetical protein
VDANRLTETLSHDYDVIKSLVTLQEYNPTLYHYITTFCNVMIGNNNRTDTDTIIHISTGFLDILLMLSEQIKVDKEMCRRN